MAADRTYGALMLQVTVDWQTIGCVDCDFDPFRFPAVPTKTAVYRLWFDTDLGPAVYFGESRNLRKRCVGYATAQGPPSTSTRMRNRIRRCGLAGWRVELSVAAPTLLRDGEPIPIDFGGKEARVFVEHAGVVEAIATPGLIVLNGRGYPPVPADHPLAGAPEGGA